MCRLFIVCYPKAPPLYALRDVFGRFGNLIDLYILNGKNCGFAQYADKDSAAEAIKVSYLPRTSSRLYSHSPIDKVEILVQIYGIRF